MAVTIRDVAEKCGLSISTVSKAFNEYGDISEETKERVRAVARQIGYFPNATARTLKTSRSYNLGVLFADENSSGLTHPFFAAVLNAFKMEAEKNGYDVTFINHRIGSPAMRYLEHCRYRNVDGVCLACVNFYDPEVEELVRSGLPCVTIDFVFDGCPAVLSQNEGGVADLVAYAYRQGHRRIAFIHGQMNSLVTESRVRGFREAMAAFGLPVPEGYLAESLYVDTAAVRRAVKKVLRLPEPPTCVLLPDDQCYLGAMEAAKELGLRIPEDVSFAGFDGIRLTQMLRPPLTTVLQDTDTMGREAARLLIHWVDKRIPDEGGNVTVPTKLITGQTVAQLG